KQLGDAPEVDQPKEDPAIAAERERLGKAVGDLDAALKQVRLLSLRADQLADRITNRRRALFTQRLFKRTSSALQLSFWRDVGDAARREWRSLGYLVESWWGSAYSKGGASGMLLAGATLLALAIAGILFVRWWRQRAFMPRTDTRFGKAAAAFLRAFQVGITAPLCTIAVLLVFDSFGLVPPRIWDIGKGLVAAVAAASFGAGVAAGLLAPGEPGRRLVAIDDATASELARRFAWGARVFGAAIFLNTIHQAVVAPVSLTVATSALFAVLVTALVANTLLRVKEAGEDGVSDVSPRAQWVRAAAWLVMAA